MTDVPPIKFGSLALTESGCFSDRKPSVDSLRAAMQFVDHLTRNVKWWAGDLVLGAEMLLGDEADQFIADNMPSMNRAYVLECLRLSKQIPLEDRVDGLSWTQHKSAMRLPLDEALWILLKAQAGQWDSRRMKEEVRQCVADAEM